ncbi:Asp-tRNA(Asn)/Glu-tRNA(Gln) amidotransferase subunit GatA [Xylocopilactobacillus apicola]|uniref:Glutamyl-tRNA(Gln) amidotransferase subunit A n=1 Tax=Xylocopilactobacillus apicola TaxID=2932184 RepID=A0AAU9DWQ6_9LACO|nr:Asp-tRNA(Asn)/Glu-tRNA(Gln) amidotransferase subunit GatA [Xylocopilactobacillus apicola]BDR58458.1 glutamyl-tRNA(Gln) amidotransferase subunit A [Xylocopilactobacillus apicola]
MKFESLSQTHQALLNKEVSAQEIVEHTFIDIESKEDRISAFITLNKEQALKEAAELDQKGDFTNFLSGLPVGIKDNIITKDLTTTAASKMLENFVPIYNATVVDKLKKSGALVAGKLNMDEFAMGSSTETSFFKITKNAWDQSKVPGGSSGGSASAVASREVLAALGSDTGGSIRQPASFNGVVGLKPTYGTVSRWGLIAFSSSLDQIGPITTNVEDNARLLEAIAGHDENDATSAFESTDYLSDLNKGVQGLRIGVITDYLEEGVMPEIVDSVKQAAAFFAKNGAVVDEVSLPNVHYAVPTYYIIASSEASSNLQRFDGIRYGYRTKQFHDLEELYTNTRSEGFGEEVKRRIMLGSFSLSAGFYDAYFKKAAQVRTLIARDFQRAFENYDLLIGPTTPTPAFGIGEKCEDPLQMYANDILTIPVNLAGLPAMSMPNGLVNGMPVGLQIIGNRFDEKTIYRLAKFYEAETNFDQQKPEIAR